MSALSHHRIGVRFKVAWGILLMMLALFDLGFGLVLWGEHRATHRIDVAQRQIAHQQQGICNLVGYFQTSVRNSITTTRQLIESDRKSGNAASLAAHTAALGRTRSLLGILNEAACQQTPTHP